jgi:hypothetical protein
MTRHRLLSWVRQHPRSSESSALITSSGRCRRVAPGDGGAEGLVAGAGGDEAGVVAAWGDLAGGPLAILGGEALLLVCSLCYLVWWSIAFAPPVQTPHPGGGVFLAGAGLCGLGGVALLGAGIVGLAGRGSVPSLGGVVLGGVVVGAALLAVTAGPLHRPVTTELPLIVIWATVQLAACAVLTASGWLAGPASSGWIGATVVATVAGLVCYLAFYRLDPVPAYWVGMVPLIFDGLAGVVFAVLVVTGH